ncbi:MAG TPA: DUF58 domain-containing protein [Methylomirabilota bacterium]|nr:DUF58 domain-containing protein [Methylomirabilota bacterium]
MLRHSLYATFRFLSSADFRIRRRFTKAGLLLLGSLAAAAVIGLDTNQTMAYQAFALLLALLAISVASSVVFRPRLAVRRILPRYGTAGVPLAYRVVVDNRGDRRLTGLVLIENLVDPRPSYEAFSDTPDEIEDADNWFDRVVGYPRWQSLIARSRGATMDEQALPPLPPGGEIEVRVELTPLRRGPLRFVGATVARPDPFGLFRALHTIPLSQSVLVLPRRYPVPDLRLPGSRKYQQGGVALAASVGDSEEFVSLRDYRPADPLRRIHWKSWARVGKPVVREYQDEFFVRHALVLDTFTKIEGTEVFEAAVSVAASVACSIRSEDALLDLMFVGPEAYCFTVGRGVAHTERMLEVLAAVRSCRDRPFAALHRLVIERYAVLSGAVCVLLGWDEARQRFVDHLDALGVPKLVLVVTPPGSASAGVPPDGPGFRRLEVGRMAEGLSTL